MTSISKSKYFDIEVQYTVSGTILVVTHGCTLAGPVLYVRPPASPDADNNSDDSRTMDEDYRRDYANQDPPSPTCHGDGEHDAGGPMAKFLSCIPDWMSGIEDALLKAVDDRPVPDQVPPPDGINTHEAIQVSAIT
jgi:hypothetical protein